MAAFNVYRATKKINSIKDLLEVTPIENERSLYKMPYKNDIYYTNTFSFTVEDKYTTGKWREAFFFEPIIKERFGIKQIVENPAKRATAVIWNDGKATVVKRAEDDPDDIYFAVASALAIRAYGSNSAFKKIIDTKYEVYEPKKEKSYTWKKKEKGLSDLRESLKNITKSLGGRNDEV